MIVQQFVGNVAVLHYNSSLLSFWWFTSTDSSASTLWLTADFTSISWDSMSGNTLCKCYNMLCICFVSNQHVDTQEESYWLQLRHFLPFTLCIWAFQDVLIRHITSKDVCVKLRPVLEKCGLKSSFCSFPGWHVEEVASPLTQLGVVKTDGRKGEVMHCDFFLMMLLFCFSCVVLGRVQNKQSKTEVTDALWAGSLFVGYI